jgi:hypothetical protein
MIPTRFEFETEPAALEGDFLREATLWLAERNVFEWRNNTGVAVNKETGQFVRFGIPGGSDLLVVVPPFGRFLGVETKAKLGRQSEKQKRFQRAVERAGGVYALAKTLEELKRAFDAASTHPSGAELLRAMDGVYAISQGGELFVRLSEVKQAIRRATGAR